MRSLRDMGHRYQQGPAVSIVRTDTCSEFQETLPLRIGAKLIQAVFLKQRNSFGER